MKTKPRCGTGTGWTLVRLGLLGVAALLMVVGISRGEVAIVLKKAVNLCLECIGLG